MTAVPFTKASACGNDFLIIDGMHAPPDLAAFSRAICGRHNGVGADGVEWLFPAQDADIRARLLNADGGEAEISGNGTRCVAAYLCADDPREKVTVRTGAGVKTCTLISHTDMSFEFETAMGEPQVGDEFSIKVAFGEVRGIPVSMGNPHFSVFVDEFPIGWQGEGAEIGKHHDFQHGINVERVLTDNGSCYRSHLFRRACQTLEIKHRRTRPYSPQTNGKAERFIQTALREWAYAKHWTDSKQRDAHLQPWIDYYNHQRPHGSLNYKPPISRSEIGTTS